MPATESRSPAPVTSESIALRTESASGSVLKRAHDVSMPSNSVRSRRLGIGDARRLELHAAVPRPALRQRALPLRTMLRAAHRRDLRVALAEQRIEFADVERQRTAGAAAPQTIELRRAPTA